MFQLSEASSEFQHVDISPSMWHFLQRAMNSADDAYDI
jgi:hypothetical protein